MFGLLPPLQTGRTAWVGEGEGANIPPTTHRVPRIPFSPAPLLSKGALCGAQFGELVVDKLADVGAAVGALRRAVLRAALGVILCGRDPQM